MFWLWGTRPSQLRPKVGFKPPHDGEWQGWRDDQGWQRGGENDDKDNKWKDNTWKDDKEEEEEEEEEDKDSKWKDEKDHKWPDNKWQEDKEEKEEEDKEGNNWKDNDWHNDQWEGATHHMYWEVKEWLVRIKATAWHPYSPNLVSKLPPQRCDSAWA
jgi:hypothetical protein